MCYEASAPEKRSSKLRTTPRRCCAFDTPRPPFHARSRSLIDKHIMIIICQYNNLICLSYGFELSPDRKSFFTQQNRLRGSTSSCSGLFRIRRVFPRFRLHAPVEALRRLVGTDGNSRSDGFPRRSSSHWLPRGRNRQFIAALLHSLHGSGCPLFSVRG